MTWLVFGENGQVAQELGALLGVDCMLMGRNKVDLLTAGQARRAIETALSQGSVEGIINAAAYTAGKDAVRTAGGVHAILRISWAFRPMVRIL